MKNLLIFLLFLSLKQGLLITTTPRQQAIWLIESNLLENYYVIGTKFFPIEETIPEDNSFIYNNDYKILVKRNHNTLYSDETVILKDNNQEYAKYRYFLPDINSYHKKKKSYVVWDIKTFCVSCHTEFKIRYFDCDTRANTFYDSLSEETDKKKLIFRKFTTSNYKYGEFQDEDELNTVLSNIMECQASQSSYSCCNPYPCLVDPGSINCICGYNSSSPECLCAKNYKSSDCACAENPNSELCNCLSLGFSYENCTN